MTSPANNDALSLVLDTSRPTRNTAPTQFVEVDGTRFAYRRFGFPLGTPIVLLQHFMRNLDDYDPAITDYLATGREVILTDNAGVGLSTGAAPRTVAAKRISGLGLPGRPAGGWGRPGE